MQFLYLHQKFIRNKEQIIHKILIHKMVNNLIAPGNQISKIWVLKSRQGRKVNKKTTPSELRTKITPGPLLNRD